MPFGDHVLRIKHKRLWSVEDDAELRRLAALNIGASRIGLKLKRVPSDIESRAGRLGISLGTRHRVAPASATTQSKS